MEITHVTNEIVAIGCSEPVPGNGCLPVFSFLLLGRQPILIDTGMAHQRDAFVEALGHVVDPADLDWIVLSHPDADHAGALPEVVRLAPRAKVVLNVISMGKLGASYQPPLPRVRWVNAGESLVAGERVLHFLRPPMYDCPSTVSVFDSRSRALFTSDGFGAFVPALTERFSELPRTAALEGMSAFCRANSPWLADVRPDRYAKALKAHADLAPSWLLPSHLPPVTADEAGAVFARAASLPGEGPLPLPGQQALDALLASVTKAAA